MPDPFMRTELLLGAPAMEQLARARVAVFGLGGVGGAAVEALSRSRVGALDLIDNDQVEPSNINRQFVAATSTVGKDKVAVMAARVHDINLSCRVTTHRCFYLPDTADQFDFRDYDYVVDAVDTVTAKLQLIMRATACGTPIISCMGTGNKLDPTAFRVADISETSVCPLAKIIRKELRKRGIEHLKVVYSTEPPIPANALGLTPNSDNPPTDHGRRSIPGSVAFVPPVAGMILAGEVVRDLAATAHPSSCEQNTNRAAPDAYNR